MADVMIKCPETGNPVPTQMDMGFETFAQLDMKDNVLGDCSECGGTHVWQKSDAFPDS